MLGRAGLNIGTDLAGIGGSFDDVEKLTVHIVDWSLTRCRCWAKAWPVDRQVGFRDQSEHGTLSSLFLLAHARVGRLERFDHVGGDAAAVGVVTSLKVTAARTWRIWAGCGAHPIPVDAVG
jgi:hypothetical protein